MVKWEPSRDSDYHLILRSLTSSHSTIHLSTQRHTRDAQANTNTTAQQNNLIKQQQQQHVDLTISLFFLIVSLISILNLELLYCYFFLFVWFSLFICNSILCILFSFVIFFCHSISSTSTTTTTTKSRSPSKLIHHHGKNIRFNFKR